MIHWNRRYSRKKLTMTAHTTTGHVLQIISTGIPNPVHLYVKSPGSKTNARVATVPSIPLAILCAEEHNLYHLRGAAQPPEGAEVNPDTTAQARRDLEEIRSGPTDAFIITVPKAQSMAAQYALEHSGIMLKIEPHQLPPGHRMSALIPKSSIYEAAKAVNQHLQELGLRPLMQLPPILGDPDHPQTWLEFLHNEYRWDNPVSIRECLWQSRAEPWEEVALRYRKLTDPKTWPGGVPPHKTRPDQGAVPAASNA